MLLSREDKMAQWKAIVYIVVVYFDKYLICYAFVSTDLNIALIYLSMLSLLFCLPNTQV